MRSIFISALLFSVSESAFASGASGSHEGSLLLPTINFAMYVALAVYLLKRPIQSAIAGRRSSFEAELKRSQADLESATAKMSAAETRLAGATSEIKKLQERIQIDAEMEADTIIAQAKERAERIVAQGKGLAAAELKSARDSIKRELISASIIKARALAASQSNDATDKLLRDRAAADVSGVLNG